MGLRVLLPPIGLPNVRKFFVMKIFFLTWLLWLAFGSTPVYALGCEEFVCNDSADLGCFQNKRSCLEAKLNETKDQRITLTNTISIINGKVEIQEVFIQQTEAEISQLEAQIGDLSQRIGGLNLSLDRLTTLLIERIQVEYKQSRVNKHLFFLTTNSANTFFSQLKYLKEAHLQTALAMQRAEAQRLAFDQQKSSKEEKQQQIEKVRERLEREQNVLAKQRNEQQFLLKETKNNEAVYQAELAKTLAELSAIQSIIAGKGSETEIGTVNAGDTIASIIIGASVCSTGSHLHFEVVKDKQNRDPAAYLQSISPLWNNEPDSPFGFGGSWDWPLFDAARITQGYGMTYYARVRRAYGGSPHTGIDMVSTSGDARVRAVQPGKLYRGSISCGGGNLRYVRVEQSDGLNTYYLHINY
ncbi:MAG: hypothetical protein A2632_02585 [Candidatus Pacebacteria bacterium RIFCSPHIGHO2_01_FULL_46_16]|nr:MAG: hypothetical protein A2632_02585 [Candidatus Pacebacteria bacterium RIFCSPHIGHO2_01_FULL_46_16]OGJ22148.1 MAG: hypothetical protein A3J60_03240 [Candidatus Pacebacteria bacterium RIFCSPHIGHO2_02_FULL_46_9]OGJ38268.1 MAG: hypothetical protein A3A82_01545 [Candidatus Pacebacteria bacterium RIFCSPLOWO2_01_FULL_47_12]